MASGRVPRHSRRGLLKLVLGIGVVLLLGGRAVREEGWLPMRGDNGDGDLMGYRQNRPGRAVPGTADSRVAIVKGDDPAGLVRRAVALAGGLENVVGRGATVFVKPNLTIPSASGLGNVTDSRVLRATIELCQEAGAGHVLVGDGSGGGDTTQIMRQAGYEPVLQATGATFVDLNADEVVTRRLTDAAGLPEYSLAKTAVEVGVLVSVAVLKVHSSAIVTLTCKNLMGIAARQTYGRPRQKLHDVGVQRVTADLVRIRRPDFAIIDGIVGLEGDSPMNGTPVPMGLIIAGRNPVSVDAVGAAVMGFDPQQLEQLTLLARHRLGEIDLQKLSIYGNAISEVQRRFRR